jgi:hypothetical protein
LSDDGDDGESLIFKDEGIVFLLTVVSRWPSDTASHPRTADFSQSVSYLEYSTLDDLAPTDVVLFMRYPPFNDASAFAGPK